MQEKPEFPHAVICPNDGELLWNRVGDVILNATELLLANALREWDTPGLTSGAVLDRGSWLTGK